MFFMQQVQVAVLSQSWELSSAEYPAALSFSLAFTSDAFGSRRRSEG
jgi:hypothetical protein